MSSLSNSLYRLVLRNKVVLNSIFIVLIVAVIYYQIESSSFEFVWFRLSKSSLLLLFLSFLISYVNISLEALKSKVVIPSLSISQHLRSIYIGVSYSILGPSWLLDTYARKVVFRQSVQWSKLLNLITWTKFTQALVTYFLGLTAFIYLFDKIRLDFEMINISSLNNKHIIYVFIVIAILWILYFVINKLSGHKFIFQMLSLSSGKLSVLISLSFFRYSTFLAQYYLIICAFNPTVGASLVDILAIVSFFLMIKSIPPSFGFGIDLGTRLISAAFLFQLIGISLHVSILVTTFIWILNQVLPAATGLILLTVGNNSRMR